MAPCIHANRQISIKGLLHGMEINMGVCPRLEFDITLIYCLGMTSTFMVNLMFYTIPLSIYGVIYDITTTPEGTLL